jgi:hypothetical protein
MVLDILAPTGVTPPLRVAAITMFVAGGFALMLGARRLGLGLMAPALFRWFVWPLIGPMLGEVPLWLIVLAAPLVVVLVGLKLLQRGVGAVYGRQTAGHVTGVYLVRLLDTLGAALAWLAVIPFRLIARLLRR